MTALLPRRRQNGKAPGAARRKRVQASRSKHNAEPRGEAREATWHDRARAVLSKPLEYRVCRGFKRLHLLSHDFEQPLVPDYARAVDERTLLSAEQESDLFIRMNYCKFRADLLRRQLPAGREAAGLPIIGPSPIGALAPPARRIEEALEEIECCLATAMRLRDCLVRAFLKLAISLIGPFVSRRHPFDELLSEAAVALLRAVEKFDPDRGFRFSTYATPAVRRQLERFVLKQHKDEQVLVRAAHLDTLPAAAGRTRADERRRESAVHVLGGMLERLDAREQLILQARFGLEAGSDTQSLQEIASRLGVCRERVRQIESRAIERLRGMSEAARLHEPWSASASGPLGSST
jgi:RNA polymerase sigma factor (sigma-70 family)